MPAVSSDLSRQLLSADIDLTHPFTTHTARAGGLSSAHLRRMVAAELLTHPMRGIYYFADLADTLDLRKRCVSLVVPEACVVTDRTAAWLHGAPMALAPGDHLRVPELSVFHVPGQRLRNGLTSSGERQLLPTDVVDLDGLRVTTPLRTACDLGRLLQRDAALAALDALLRLQRFELESLLMEVRRFRGFRGVRQLRLLAPLSDPGSESFGESALRLRWYDAGLERPETQVEVRDHRGRIARLDLGSRPYSYAAEYDGAEFHGPDRRNHDQSRRAWLRDSLGWTVDAFVRDDVFGRNQNATARLRQAIDRAKVRTAIRSAR